MDVRQYSSTALQDDSTGRLATAPLASRRAEASMILKSVIVASPQPGDLAQALARGGDRLGEAAEPAYKLLGQRLHVPAGDRAEQDEFE